MAPRKMVSFFATVIIAAIAFGQLQAAPKVEAVPGEFVVKIKANKKFNKNAFAKSFGAQEVRTVSEKHGVYLIKNNMLVKDDAAIVALNSTANFEYVEPNYIYRANVVPNDPKFGELWGLHNLAQKGGRAGVDVGAQDAWEIQTGSRDVVVAVIDTGVDYTHQDLKDNMWTNVAEAQGAAGVDDDNNGYVDDIHGYDFVNNDGDPMDDHGHGTHCSGTIGAKGDDGAGIVGVAWNVRIMAVKFLSGSGSGTLEDAIKAIDYATNMGAHIQSNSWGGGGFTQSLLDSIVRAEQADVTFVAAAGNETNNNDSSPSFPATYDVPNIISVAAINNQGTMASFSNWGKTTVHVAAPGVDIFSSVPFATNSAGYDTWSGTSMATPHVAGVAALVKSQFPSMTYKEIKERIMNGVQQMGSIRSKVVSGGLVNAYYALTGETAPPDMEDPYNWQTTEATAESAHPYLDKTRQEFTIHVPGATSVAVFFELFETERGYDNVEFYDISGNLIAKWSGNHTGEFSPSVNGDTVKLIFTTDDSVQGQGFKVTRAAYR